MKTKHLLALLLALYSFNLYANDSSKSQIVIDSINIENTVLRQQLDELVFINKNRDFIEKEVNQKVNTLFNDRVKSHDIVIDIALGVLALILIFLVFRNEQVSKEVKFEIKEIKREIDKEAEGIRLAKKEADELLSQIRREYESVKEQRKTIDEQVKKIRESEEKTTLAAIESKISQLLSEARNFTQNNDYENAIENYKKVIKLNPQNDSAYNDWAVVLYNKAGNLNQSKGKKTEYLIESIELYHKALNINKKNTYALSNIGSSVLLLIDNNPDKGKPWLDDAITKSERAIELSPSFTSAYSNLSGLLIYQSKTKTGVEQKKLLDKAIDTCKIEIKQGGSHYNLACAYAIKKDKLRSLKHLENSFKLRQISIEHVKEDNDFDNLRNSNEFNALIKKYEFTLCQK